MQEILLKRVYEEASPNDGYRVLVDRLWPRGVSKEKAHLDEWNKDIAPSTVLREWFHHDPARWDEFCEKYKKELQENNSGPEFLNTVRNQERVTLVYGAKDTEHCHPIILRDYLIAL